MPKKAQQKKVEVKKAAGVKGKVAEKKLPAKKAAPAAKASPVKKAVPVAKAVPAKKAAKQAETPSKKTIPASKTVAVKKAVSPAVKQVSKAKAAPAKAVEIKAKAKTKAMPEKKEVKKGTVKTEVKKEEKKKSAAPSEKKEPQRPVLQEGDLRSALLERRESLIKEIVENRVRESDSLKREIGDIYDEASTERDRELSLILGDRDRQKLIEIDDALQRIETGEYGICESCGEKIAPGRLKAQPFTKLCVNCKADEERQEARRKKFEGEGVYRNLTYGEEEEG